MILTGAGGSLLSHSARRHLLTLSAVCVLLTGVISLARGSMFVQFPESAAPGVLPVLPLAARIERRGVQTANSPSCSSGHFAYY